MRTQFIISVVVSVLGSGLLGCGGSAKVAVTPVAPPVAVEYAAAVRPMAGSKQLIHSGANEGLCFDVWGDNAAQHAEVALFRCNGKENQRWSFGPGAGGAVQVGGIGGLCLSVAPGPLPRGSMMELLTCNGSVAQEFKFFVDGRVRELGTNKCVTPGAGANGQGLMLAPCDVANAAQVFTVADH